MGIAHARQPKGVDHFTCDHPTHGTAPALASGTRLDVGRGYFGGKVPLGQAAAPNAAS